MSKILNLLTACCGKKNDVGTARSSPSPSTVVTNAAQPAPVSRNSSVRRLSTIPPQEKPSPIVLELPVKTVDAWENKTELETKKITFQNNLGEIKVEDVPAMIPIANKDSAVHKISTEQAPAMIAELTNFMRDPMGPIGALRNTIPDEEKDLDTRLGEFIEKEFLKAGLSPENINDFFKLKPASVILGKHYNGYQHADCLYTNAPEDFADVLKKFKDVNIEEIIIDFFQKELAPLRINEKGTHKFATQVAKEEAEEYLFGIEEKPVRSLFVEELTMASLLAHGDPHIPNFIAIYRHILQQRNNLGSVFSQKPYKDMDAEKLHHFLFKTEVENGKENMPAWVYIQDSTSDNFIARQKGQFPVSMTSPFNATFAYEMANDAKNGLPALSSALVLMKCKIIWEMIEIAKRRLDDYKVYLYPSIEGVLCKITRSTPEFFTMEPKQQFEYIMTEFAKMRQFGAVNHDHFFSELYDEKKPAVRLIPPKTDPK